ncbi:transglycosylase domain-containing protein [Peribacillus sp. B-H-3]|uniref:transglycosylase domain-containing protein n=1 Tax=Peribacillus sp. B-H-3 TaxID=3400420 RepID=UPI003B026CCF
MELITERFKRSSKYIRAFIIVTALSALLLFLMFLALFMYAKVLGPPPVAVPQSTLYYSESGKVIGETSHGQKRYWVPIQEISPDLINATVAVEDRQFYTHRGFDLKRIAGAVLADMRSMSKVQGASTITQQYARNLYLGHDKTWKRKLSEAFYTIRLEMNYSKRDILEGYLNTIYYGHGAYGAQAASLYYYGKNAKDLTLSEASMLAGVPKGPSRYSPLANLEKAKLRQQVVLSSMVQKKYISTKQKLAASRAPLSFNGEKETVHGRVAPYFQDAVKQALKTQLHLDDRTIELGGLRVYTTLNEKTQAAAEKSFSDIISSQSNVQAALVAMNPKTGAVTALAGGRDYDKSPFNRATQAIRQPGSTIKPILYYSALEKGFTPSTTLKSEATTFKYDGGQSTYTPHNYNSQYANGDITMAQAIALSDNIFAVKTNLFLGEKSLVQNIRKFGLTTKMHASPSLALGTSGVRVIEMVNAYSLLANGGKHVTPIFIKRVENQKGDVIFEQKTDHKQLLDRNKAFVMTEMLTGVFDKKLNGYTKVTGSTIAPELTRPYAGKSGSTTTDSWMIGYAPQQAAGVWVGYDQAKKMENPAENVYAKKIWADFMETSLEEIPVKPFKKPSGVVGVYVNPQNGKLATKDCPVKRKTYFVKGTEPEEYCTEHLPNSQNPILSSPEKHKKSWYKRILHFWGH